MTLDFRFARYLTTLFLALISSDIIILFKYQCSRKSLIQTLQVVLFVDISLWIKWKEFSVVAFPPPGFDRLQYAKTANDQKLEAKNGLTILYTNSIVSLIS